MPYRSSLQVDRQTFFQENPWAFWFGVVLAINAGYINVILLGFSHLPVSHLTGTISRLSIDIAEQNQQDLRLIGGIVGGFVAGCMLSGMLIGNTKLRPGRRYGVALMLVGVLLGIATLGLLSDLRYGITLAAMACGLQNAMYSSYHGLILRTTHLTGIITDIGVLFGLWIRQGRIEWWKLTVLGGTVFSFLLGGIFGAYALHWWNAQALIVSALWCFILGLSYFLHKWRAFHQAHKPKETH